MRAHAGIPASVTLVDGEQGDNHMGFWPQIMCQPTRRVTALVALKHSGKQRYTSR